MADIAGIASSALSAYSLKQTITASNITKVNTSDSDSSSVVMQSVKGGGVSATVVQNSDKVDISREAVDLVSTGSAFKANLKVLNAADEMSGTLFSIRA